ncbi:MAG: amidohydrolase family protein [Candidatus Microthrix parvicella]
MNLDVVIRNGRVFDGTGVPGAIRDLGIRDGVVVAVSTEPLDGEGAKEIDATGHWVLPGFVDVHTHYDAEVLAAPGLEESVRHGVTTVVMGSCSLSTILSDPEDSADMFSRVEAVPHEHVLSTLAEHQTWDDAATYIDALESLPLGPNVAAFLGHSDLRASVMAWAAPGAAAACCKARRMPRTPPTSSRSFGRVGAGGEARFGPACWWPPTRNPFPAAATPTPRSTRSTASSRPT